MNAPAAPVDTVWYTRCPVPTAQGIAIQEGWLAREFAADGIDVRSLATSTEPRVRASHYLLEGNHLIRQGGSSPVFHALARGVDIRILGVAHHDVSYPVLALKDSGITEAPDLRGRRLAVPKRTNDTVDFWHNTVLRVYDRALTSAGLTFDDVELVEIRDEREGLKSITRPSARTGSLWGPDSAPSHQRREIAALLRGEVDVIASEGSYAATAIPVLDAAVVFDAGRELGDIDRANNDSPTVLSVNGELLDAHPDLVVRWLTRVVEAADWAAGHELEAKRLAALEVGIAEENVDTYFGPDLHLQLGLGLEPERIQTLQAFGDHLHRHARIPQPVDVSAAVDPEPLRRAVERIHERVA